MTRVYPLELSKEQVNLILDEARATNDFDYMLFMTLKTTGRRIGEIYGIDEVEKIGRKKVGNKKFFHNGKWYKIDKTVPIYKKTGKFLFGVKLKDIDFEQGLIKVWVLKRRKYIQDETIVPPDTLNLIKNYVRRNRLQLEDYVFRKDKRGLRNINNVLKNYARKVGIQIEIENQGVKQRLSVHCFRHYFITQLKRQGWTNERIAKLTGHKVISTLSIYDHVVAKDIKEEALSAIGNL